MVIDVLRASTPITAALKNGAKDVIPAEAIADVIEVTQGLSCDNVLRCSERDSRMVEGFNYRIISHVSNDCVTFPSAIQTARDLKRLIRRKGDDFNFPSPNS